MRTTQWARDRRSTAQAEAETAEDERKAAKAQADRDIQLANTAATKEDEIQAQVAAFEAAEDARRRGLPV